MSDGDQPIDVAAILAGTPKLEVQDVDIDASGVNVGAAEFQERIKLARHVLMGLGGIFVFVIIGYVWVSARSKGASAAKDVFEFVKETFPPIVTLILGAYFTRKNE
jgi:hypothetical protein